MGKNSQSKKKRRQSTFLILSKYLKKVFI